MKAVGFFYGVVSKPQQDPISLSLTRSHSRFHTPDSAHIIVVGAIPIVTIEAIPTHSDVEAIPTMTDHPLQGRSYLSLEAARAALEAIAEQEGCGIAIKTSKPSGSNPRRVVYRCWNGRPARDYDSVHNSR